MYVEKGGLQCHQTMLACKSITHQGGKVHGQTKETWPHHLCTCAESCVSFKAVVWASLTRACIIKLAICRGGNSDPRLDRAYSPFKRWMFSLPNQSTLFVLFTLPPMIVLTNRNDIHIRYQLASWGVPNEPRPPTEAFALRISWPELRPHSKYVRNINRVEAFLLHFTL